MKKYPKYKDSGISWLGQIPEHWEVKRIASLFKNNFDVNKDFEYKHAFKFNYGALVPKNEIGSESEYKDTYVKYTILSKDDIVINGLNLNYDFVSQRVAIAPTNGIITSAYVAIKPKQSTYSDYYLYVLKTMDGMKMFHSMGTGIRLTLSYDELKKQLLPIPPHNEQQKIVEFLDSKISKINSYVLERERELQVLTELKQSQIAEVVTKGINPNVPMKDSGISWIGQIPAHWSVSKISDIFTERREKVSDKEYQALSVSKQGITLQLDSAVKTDNGDNRKKVCVGDFVVNSRSDRKGSCGVSQFDGSVSLINIVLQPRKELCGQFFHYLFRSNNYIEEFYRLGRGIVADLWTTRYSEMKNIYIPIPPREEMEQIVHFIEDKCQSIDSMISNLEAEIAYLKEYKQSLIADAVTGAINVQ